MHHTDTHVRMYSEIIFIHVCWLNASHQYACTHVLWNNLHTHVLAKSITPIRMYATTQKYSSYTRAVHSHTTLQKGHTMEDIFTSKKQRQLTETQVSQISFIRNLQSSALSKQHPFLNVPTHALPTVAASSGTYPYSPCVSAYQEHHVVAILTTTKHNS